MRKPLLIFIVAATLLAACSKGSTLAGSEASLTTDKAPGAKPTVTIPDSAPPTTLQITDLTVGDGAQATETSTVSVNYLLITWEDKKEVDGSFGGQPLSAPLSNLVKGWQQGIPGMKVGGRRQLIIPPELGYGPAGSHPLGGKTLVFIIDLLNVG